MQTFIRKITSRKFLSCIAGVVLGISMIFGVDENVVSTIAGAITSVASVVMYIYTEGKIDAAAVSGAANKVTDAIDAVKEIEE
jgi:phage shock protein PspC (stress-responsive transcriptional regulator)